VSSTEPKIRATFIVLGVVSVICIVWEARIIPKPMTSADVQAAAETGAERGVEKHPSNSNPQPETAAESQKAAISSTVEAVVRANIPKSDTRYLAGISDHYLSTMTQTLGTALIQRWTDWWNKDGSMANGALVRMSGAQNAADRQKIKEEVDKARTSERAQYENDMVLLVRDADVARKAILQHLNSYPPTSAEDKKADVAFSTFSVSRLDDFNAAENGGYLVRLSRRIAP